MSGALFTSWNSHSMATTNSTSTVPGSAYERYSRSEVLELLETEEPMLQDSDDELELDLGSGDEM